MKIATLTESSENENRVAITPDSAKFLIKFGHEVIIQSGPGEKARFSDNDYKSSGITLNFLCRLDMILFSNTLHPIFPFIKHGN